MPSLNVSDDLYQQLAQRAAALNLTVEELVASLAKSLDRPNGAVPPASATEPYVDWTKKFSSWMAEVQARATRYPPGFVMDDSRASIYQGCGE